MKKFLCIVVLGFLWVGNVNATECDTTIEGATTDQLSCSDNESLTVTGSITYDNANAVLATQKNNVSVVNSGDIKVTKDSGSLDAAIQGQSSLNLTVTNSGTIWAQDDYGIKLIEAEKVTITNEAGGTIKGTPASSGSQIAIGGTKMGNCGTCLNESTTSSGEGLTLHNYGTIDANSRTVYGGHASGHTSKKTRIFNYDGGMINATTSSAIKFRFAEDIDIQNYLGATIQSGSGDFGIDLKESSTVTINNAGTILAGNRYGVACNLCTNLTLTNSGTIEATANSALYLQEISGTNTITNTGTLKNGSGNSPITIKDGSGLTIINSGTIESAGQYGIYADNAFSPTITNSGTISALSSSTEGIGINLSQNDGENLGTNAVITNSGTIEALGDDADGIRLGDGTGVYNGVTITNSGTIAAGDNSVWIDGSTTTGTNIITKGEATYTGEIDMESAVVAMTLDCSISKDMDIEIHNKTNMTITNNLCGNDTFEILDSSKNADADNSETNGYLRIYGEDLDIDSHNKKYRSEIFISSLDKVFNSVKDIKEKSVFFAKQKRNNVYNNSIEGVSGYFDKDDPIDRKINTYLSYFSQNANFNNKESLRSENLGLGYQANNNNENLTFKSLIGISSNKIQDVEIETNQIKTKNFIGQFAALHSNYKKNKKIDENNELTLNVSSIYGIHRLPKYLSNFTDGDLSVDTAIDQVFNAGFNVEYSTTSKNGFILKPYSGLSYNNTLSNDINLIADGENKEAGHVMNGVLAKKVGLSITKNNNDFGLNINLEHKNQDGLIDNNINFSISKKLQNIAKLRNQSERADPELEKLFDQLQLIKENERATQLANKVIEENKVMKDLIIKLIKENQKLKTENLLFKNN